MLTWADLHAQRWDWVDEPVRRFIDACDPSLMLKRHLDTADPEYNAVLYGRTQTGKTTLLLRLLGVRDDAMDEVADVLRGGRGRGRSATALPTRYQWSSEDDRWQYRIVTPQTLTGYPQSLSQVEVLQQLASLRDAAGRPASTDGVVEVGIPRRCRGTAATVLPRVLDLPGDGADTAEERAWAEQLIRTFVPAAHLVILVVSADRIATDLARGLAVEMPELAMWRDVPERFRIAATHFYSSASIREQLVGDPAFAQPEALRATLLRELKTGDLAFGADDARIMEVLHPLEYGSSWEGLRTHFPEAFAVAEGLVAQELDRLGNCLVGVAAEDMRRIGVVRAAATVSDVTRRHIAGLREELDDLNRELDHERLCRSQLHAACVQARSQRELARDLRRMIDGLEVPPDPGISLDGHDQPESGSAMRQRGHHHAAALTSAWSASWQQWAASDEVARLVVASGLEPEPPHIEGIFIEEWGCRSLCGERCTARRRLRPWRNSPDYCGGLQVAASERARQIFAERFEEAVRDWRKRTIATLRLGNRDLAARDRNVAALEAAMAESGRKIDARLRERDKAWDKVRAAESASEEAIARADRLGEELASALTGEIGRLERLGACASTPEERLAAGLGIALALTNAQSLGVAPAGLGDTALALGRRAA